MGRPLVGWSDSWYAERVSKRIKTGLTADETTSMIEAAAFARSQGWMPTKFITIRLAPDGVTLPKGVAQERVRAFLKHARDWLRYHEVDLVHVWVIENASRLGTIHQHVHMLAYCPEHLYAGWQRHQRGWMKAAGIPWRKDAIKTEPAGQSLVQFKGLLRYFGKGLEDGTWREHLRIEDRGPQGLVIGKRRGCSQNIGDLARARHYAALNARGIPAPRGGRWHPTTVQRVEA